MKLEIQKWLRNGNTLEELKSIYAIDHKQHPKHTALYQFKYNQIESPMQERIVQECRGIILDSNNNWNVVAYGYSKFFNNHEPNAAVIDWNTAKVQEKLDGSLIQLFHYNGWSVSTSGMPDAGGEVNGYKFTFSDLFWRTVRENGYELKIHPDFTYMFELTTPYNRVVVQHNSCKLTLIGIRNIESGLELDIDKFGPMGVPAVKSFELKTIEDVQKSLEFINPIKQEGFVVVDANFNRVKVKSPKYVMLHQLKDSLSPKRMLEIIRKGESEETLSYFPELKEEFTRIKNRFDELVTELENSYNENEHIKTQKDFALAVKAKKFSGGLFALRSGKVSSIRQWLGNDVTLDKLHEEISSTQKSV